MLKIAAKKANLSAKCIKLHLMDIMDLKFEDNSFNSVVSIFVFCSVPDPVAGLKELNRVCKVGGHIYFLEHVRSRVGIIGKIMDYLNPLLLRITGANINRDIIKNIKAAGLNIKEVRSYFFSIIKIVDARAINK